MIVQLKFEGPQAEFLAKAAPASRAAYCRSAIMRACSATLGEDAPEAPPRKGPEAGSRIPEARALGLSTSEYRRRVGVLARAGQAATQEAVAAVPPAKKRQAQVK